MRPTFIPESPGAAGTIERMQQRARRAKRSEARERPGVPVDESRVLMMRREKAMTVEQRIELFERLSRDAAWARSAKRIR